MNKAKQVKVAKVIATSFVPRTVREKTGLSGTPVGFFSHSQNFPTRESIIDLINFSIAIELKCDPGELVDLIIVNSDSGWQEGRLFLDSINGKGLQKGKIRVLHRKNFGLSYGAYSHAFMTLRSEYDYFIFTEDDIIIGRNGYASRGIEIFNEMKNCGFVAYQGITSTAIDLGQEDAFSAHGGIGLSSTNVLDNVARHYGALPHANETSPQTYQDQLRFGEVAFTNKIYKLGFRLTSVPDNMKLYDFAYDLMRGLDVRRFPTFSEKLALVAKKMAYKFTIVRTLHGIWKARCGQTKLITQSTEDWAGR
jgi:hypothetical protein